MAELGKLSAKMTLSSPKRPRPFGALIWVEVGVTLGLCLAPFVLSNFMLIMLTQFLLLALLAISFDPSKHASCTTAHCSVAALVIQ